MRNQTWGFWLLTAFVVGNMVGSGIFMLPTTLANTASPLAVMLTWLVTGFGVLMIALVFGNLAMRRPDLKAGPQSYAKALFRSEKAGNAASFGMVWSYWVANAISNVAVITSFVGYLSSFFPVMRSSKVVMHIGSMPLETGKLVTFVVGSVTLWGIHFLLKQNIHNGGKLNFVTTASKVIGFALFIVVALLMFQSSKMGQMYTAVVDDSGISHGLFGQINLAALATLWAFVGIESAAILSGRARSERDVKKATITGLAIALVIYLAVSLLTMGILPQEVLKASDKPFVDALSVMLGSTGANVMAVLASVSLFGSAIGWIMVSAEVPFQAAKTGVLPSFFAKTNQSGSPVNALKVTNFMSQLFIFSTISGTISEAYLFLTTAATLAFLIPYFVSAAFFLKLVWTGEAYQAGGKRWRDGVVALLALVYSIWVIKSGTADMKTFILGIGLFASGFVVYPFMVVKKSKERATFTDTVATDAS